MCRCYFLSLFCLHGPSSFSLSIPRLTMITLDHLFFCAKCHPILHGFWATFGATATALGKPSPTSLVKTMWVNLQPRTKFQEGLILIVLAPLQLLTRDFSLFVWLWLIINDRKFPVGTVFFSHTNQPVVLLHEPANRTGCRSSIRQSVHRITWSVQIPMS